jgi:hypothetical protein
MQLALQDLVQSRQRLSTRIPAVNLSGQLSPLVYIGEAAQFVVSSIPKRRFIDHDLQRLATLMAIAADAPTQEHVVNATIALVELLRVERLLAVPAEADERIS